MSMHDYPLTAPVAFLIDHEVAAYIMLNQDQTNDCVPDGVKKILDADDFAAAIKRYDRALRDEQYFNIEDAHEVLESYDVDHIYASGFDGSTTALDRSLQEIADKGEDFSDDFIAYLEPMYQASLFNAPYKGIEDLLLEFKNKLAPVGAFPSDFDWASKLVKVEGTYFA